MDARTQDAAARILHDAFDGKVVVSRPVAVGGRIERWEQQTPHSLIAAWQQKGWRVDLVDGWVDNRVLRLVPREGDAVASNGVLPTPGAWNKGER